MSSWLGASAVSQKTSAARVVLVIVVAPVRVGPIANTNTLPRRVVRVKAWLPCAQRMARGTRLACGTRLAGGSLQPEVAKTPRPPIRLRRIGGGTRLDAKRFAARVYRYSVKH